MKEIVDIVISLPGLFLLYLTSQPIQKRTSIVCGRARRKENNSNQPYPITYTNYAYVPTTQLPTAYRKQANGNVYRINLRVVSPVRLYLKLKNRPFRRKTL